MKFSVNILLLFITNFAIAQDSLTVGVDEKYREDQFYASITYNRLVSNPDGVSQSNFSTGFHFGFIRDMPFNERRNWAIGLGLGASSNSYNQNLLITENENGINFSLPNALTGKPDKNKFTNYLIDLPIELRWRTSNATDYKFWRIYTGFKLSYLVYNSTKLESDSQNIKLTNLDVFNKFQYGATLSAGYGTWNFQLYYGLNSIFNNSAELNGASINSKSVRVGIIFYIL